MTHAHANGSPDSPTCPSCSFRTHTGCAMEVPIVWFSFPGPRSGQSKLWLASEPHNSHVLHSRTSAPSVHSIGSLSPHDSHGHHPSSVFFQGPSPSADDHASSEG